MKVNKNGTIMAQQICFIDLIYFQGSSDKEDWKNVL